MYRLCLLLCCLFLGCGNPSPYLVRAIVMLDDKPLTEAEVTLIPYQESSPVPFGITDMQGNVSFTTDDKDGVFPGSYIVVISKEIEEKMLSNNEIRAFAEVGIRYRPKMVQLVPEKYTDSKTSGLKVHVGYWHSPDLTLSLWSNTPPGNF